ncbi:MAG: 30S ribosomal protein S16 [Phycisphaera sp.]|nr:MAG: 30S ribosomal protein S16 [Phycisphaera sp.]
MVRIRMQRLGRTHRPFYRIAAAEKRVKRDGKVLENLGWYNPIEKDPEKQLMLHEERIQYWLSVGAQPSDTMMDILGNRELLTPKLKDAWLAKREADRNRVGCKVGLATAEKAQTEIGELSSSDDAEGVDLAGYASSISEAVNEARAAVSAADPKAADAAKAKAEGALSEAKGAVDKATNEKKAAAEAEAAAEAKKKAEEEAAAAAEAPAEEVAAEEEKPAEG